MPRKARIQAESGIYHVMLRGIDRDPIFRDVEDNAMFLNILRETKIKSGYKLLAYCLMGNHVHLLIKEEKESLGQIMKRIGVRFVYCYNAKYQRVGHLFQDRFKSEAVEDERYLCTVIRYIHQNPIKAGICREPEEYPYSSFAEYIGKPDLVDLDCVEEYVSAASVIEMSKEYMTEECLEIKNALPKYMTDRQAKQVMTRLTDCEDSAAFQALPAAERDKIIQKMKQSGLSVRQICRLTGMTYYSVQKSEKQPPIKEPSPD